MDTIVAAVIGAVAAIGAALITASRERSKREQLQRQQQSASKALSNAQKHKYGFFADALQIKVEILDLEANCVTTREWRGLRVSPETAMTAIPGFFSLSSGEFTEYPQVTSKNTDFPKAVTMRRTRTEPNICEYAIEVTGMLTPHDPPLDCTVHVGHRGAFLMSREDVEHAYPSGTFRNEYQRVYIEIPLEELELEVSFPKGYTAEAFPGVFIGRSETMDDLELHRIKSKFQRTERGARLAVEGPLLGYSYAIYWVSPTKAAVAGLQKLNETKS